MFAQLKEKTVWTAIVRLGVFFFVFLGLEYLFDNLMAAVTDSTGVVRAQTTCWGSVPWDFWHMECYRSG